MKQMLKISLWTAGVLLYAAIQVSAQTVTVKSSPANDALNHASQEITVEQKSFDTLLQQAKSTIDMSQKQLQAKLNELTAALQKDLKADKKYKDRIDAIETTQKQMADLGKDASQKFQTTAGPIQQKIQSDNALINGLIPVVKQENGLPDNATFDIATQKWSVPAKAAEPKK